MVWPEREHELVMIRFAIPSLTSCCNDNRESFDSSLLRTPSDLLREDPWFTIGKRISSASFPAIEHYSQSDACRRTTLSSSYLKHEVFRTANGCAGGHGMRVCCLSRFGVESAGLAIDCPQSIPFDMAEQREGCPVEQMADVLYRTGGAYVNLLLIQRETDEPHSLGSVSLRGCLRQAPSILC